MLSKENIISKLDEIRRCSNKKGFTFYISTIDLNDEKTRSTFHSNDIDEVAWHLSGQSLTCGVMTIQQIEDG